MKLVKSGAYIADRLSPIDWREWQTWLQDPAMRIEAANGFLRIFGVTSKGKRCFTGLVSRRLHPAGTVLMVEIRAPYGVSQPGRYGFVAHLCNRLVGDHVKTLGIPDNNCEVALGRVAGKAGWFFWYNNHMKKVFYKWVKEASPLPLFGDEEELFRLVRISYNPGDRLAVAAVFNGSGWIRLGSVKMHKHFSAVELKIDASTPGLGLEAHFRNCRLFPHPLLEPVKVFVGDPRPLVKAEVLLRSADGRVVSKGIVGEDGVAKLWLPPEAVYPMSGRIEVVWKGSVLADCLIPAEGVTGIYPGDFYSVFEKL